MNDFTQLVDLAAERLGGRVIAANDEFFAPKENLLKQAKPIFVEGKFTSRGHWMDGWETRRRRTPGCDWCIIRLGLPGILRGALVDTSFFTGNYPARFSLEGCKIGGAVPNKDEKKQLLASTAKWTELLPETALKGDSQNHIAIEHAGCFTHVRFKIYPDGGVARLRVYGQIHRDWSKADRKALVDLAAMENGGRVIACNDRHYGSPENLTAPGRAADMGDGWETRRRREPGEDWAILALGGRGRIKRIEVDTAHFKGNYPDRCSIQAADVAGGTEESLVTQSMFWPVLLPEKKLEADKLHRFDKDIADLGHVSHVRFSIYPDGGVSRLRLWGELA